MEDNKTTACNWHKNNLRSSYMTGNTNKPAATTAATAVCKAWNIIYNKSENLKIIKKKNQTKITLVLVKKSFI